MTAFYLLVPKIASVVHLHCEIRKALDYFNGQASFAVMPAHLYSGGLVCIQ